MSENRFRKFVLELAGSAGATFGICIILIPALLLLDRCTSFHVAVSFGAGS